MMGASFVACDDVWEPAIENTNDITSIYTDPKMAQNLLGNAWVVLPYDFDPNSDLATDDCVSNDADNSYRKIAAGAWKKDSDPTSRWRQCYHAIQYLNIFIEECEKVKFYSSSDIINQLYIEHYRAEAYAMRAMFHFYILQIHAGYVDGKLMGIPLHLASESGASNFNQPRATFQETLEQINKDFDYALQFLPERLGDVEAASSMPKRYIEQGISTSAYNQVYGESQMGRVDGATIRTIRAQMDLWAASAAYNKESGVTYAQAAKELATILMANNGIAGIDPLGCRLYKNKEMINAVVQGVYPQEVVWGYKDKGVGPEENNFPPTLEGKGRTNPSQNLVDAFPMTNGYPITDSRSGYDSKNPYEGRDIRFYDAIIYNGATLREKVIDVTANGSSLDGMGSGYKEGKSTRTGYYLNKFCRDDVNPDANSKTEQEHYKARIRYSELYLGYAEAANEAEGPMANVGGANFSAYDVIKALRQRAGICAHWEVEYENGAVHKTIDGLAKFDEKITENGKSRAAKEVRRELVTEEDPYLESIKNNKDEMRKMIRNERRLEFCFENKRFWDLRRWKVSLEELNTPVMGVKVTTAGDGTASYSTFQVDERRFKDYMYYAPIPYNETLKFNALKQNDGWE